MNRSINLTPVPSLFGAASAVTVFILAWLASKPGELLFDASRLAVISVWTGGLAALCLLYIKRYFLALWLHGALAACFWTRILAGADRQRAQALGPYGLDRQLHWIVTDDLLPLFCIALATSLMLPVAAVAGARWYRRARGGAS